MQSNGLQTLDYLVFLFYFVVVAGYGYWIYNKKKSELDKLLLDWEVVQEEIDNL